MKHITQIFKLILTIILICVGNIAWGDTTYKLEQVTSVSAGQKYVFVQSSHAMSNTVSSSALQTETGYKTTGLTGTESYVWTLESATGGYYMKNDSRSSNKYLKNSSDTAVSFGSEPSVWTFTFSGNYVTIRNKSNSDRYLGYTNATSYAYKAYSASGYSHSITVYQLVDESTPVDTRSEPELAYSESSCVAFLTESNTFPTLSNTNNLSPINYSSSVESVATINSSGVITLIAAGTTTITASFDGDETYKAGSASYELTVSTPVDNTVTYTKITNASDLADGDIIIFVYEGDNCAMGAAKTNNYDIQTISINEGIASLSSGLTEITLVKDGNYWRFKVGDNSYLYAAGGTSSNYLKASTLGTVGDNGKASISISNGNATIIFQGNNSADYRCSLRYNISSDLFACYKSSSSKTDYSLVQIYRKESIRTLNSADGGAYATMYYSNLAFKVPEGVTAKTFKLVNGALQVSVVYETGKIIPADEAVVLSGSAGDKTFKVATTDVVKDPYNTLKGSDVAAITTGGDKYYALSLDKNNENIGFYWMTSDGSAFMNGAHKAYLAISDISNVKSFYTFSETESSGIEDVRETKDIRKDYYDLTGRKVTKLVHGLYIVNGTKVYLK